MRPPVFPPHVYPLPDEWTRPLDLVVRAIEGERHYRHFDRSDFMLMGKIVRRPRPDVYLHKHRYTRRYINLDQAGHAYRYIAPKSLQSDYPGRYVAHRDLRTALDHLDLWMLPWMKPGLERFRYGLPAEDYFVMRPQTLDYEEVADTDEALAAYAERHLAEMAEWEARKARWIAAGEWPLDGEASDS